MKNGQLFTAAEFLATLEEWEKEVALFNSREHEDDGCPGCLLVRLVEENPTVGKQLKALVNTVEEYTNPLRVMLRGGNPSIATLSLLANLLVLGARMGRAHAENERLREMIR